MPQLIQLGSSFASGQSPYDIFQDRMRTIDALAETYKQYQEKKFNNQLMSTILLDIENSSNADIPTIPPPLEMDKFKEWAGSAMGMLQMEKFNIPETNKALTIPKMSEFSELLTFVQNLPDGEIDWEKSTALLSQQLEKGRSVGQLGESLISMLMGGGVNQRDKLMKDIELTQTLQGVLYPEQADPIEQIWKQAGTLPSELRADYLRQHGIDIPEATEKQIDYDALNQFMADNNLELGTATINAKGEPSYTFKPRKDLDIQEMMMLMKEAEENGIKLSYTQDGMSMSLIPDEKPSKPTSDYERWLDNPPLFEAFKKATATEPRATTGTVKQIEDVGQYLYDNTTDEISFARTINTLLSNNVKVPDEMQTTEYFAGILEEKYDELVGKLGTISEGISKGERFSKEGESLEDMYNRYWNILNEYIAKIEQHSGKRLDNPFISLDEYNPDLVPFNVVNPFSWGKQTEAEWYNPFTWGKEPKTLRK